MITVIPTGMLSQYVDGQSRLQLEAGASVVEILRSLGIPSELVAMALVDNRQVSKDGVPPDGATLTLLPLVGGG
jgi:sulfur carrier protein ThiS